jgi:hypothetical protein
MILSKLIIKDKLYHIKSDRPSIELTETPAYDNGVEFAEYKWNEINISTNETIEILNTTSFLIIENDVFMLIDSTIKNNLIAFEKAILY